MKKFKRLFSRRSDGGLQVWDLEVEGNKYRVTSGISDGKKVTNSWTECQGKNVGRANATTPEQQAMAEAVALRAKKMSEGYCETEAALADVKLFEPMLARQWDDYKDDAVFPVYAQPKLDGIRCLAKVDGLFSRKGKPHNNLEHVWHDLQPILAKHPGIVIDGEAYADKLNNDFDHIVHLVKQVKPTAADKADSAALIKYHVYDMYDKEHPEYSFVTRQETLRDLLSKCPTVQLVSTVVCNNLEELDAKYAEFLEAGYEGEMVRTNTPYENKRTKALLKRKEFKDGEFVIADIEEGVGNRAGAAGAVVLAGGGKAGIRGSRAFTVGLLKNRAKLIGQQATIRYQNLTPDGKLRFPVCVAIRDYE